MRYIRNPIKVLVSPPPRWREEKVRVGPSSGPIFACLAYLPFDRTSYWFAHS